MGFDSRSEFLFTDGSMGKNVIIFGADMSSSVHIDNKNKDILNIVERPTQGLVVYPINFTQPNKRFAFSLHYNGSNNSLFANATQIYQFKSKEFQ